MTKHKFNLLADLRVIAWSMTFGEIKVSGPGFGVVEYMPDGNVTFEVRAIETLDFKKNDIVIVSIDKNSYECEVESVVEDGYTPEYTLSHFDERAYAEAQAVLEKNNAILARG